MRAWIARLLFRRSRGMMTCHEVGEVLQQYLDGELDDVERARRIAAHLDDCLRCGMEVETYQRIKAALAARRAVVPPDAVDRLRSFGERLARGDDLTSEP